MRNEGSVRVGRSAAEPDRLLGVITTLVGTFFIFQSLRLSIFEGSRPGPGFFPLMSAVLMAGAGLWLVVGLARAEHPRTDVVRVPLRAVATVLAAFAGYVLLIPTVGYAISTFGFAVAILRTFAGYGWRRSLVAGAALAAAHVLVFEYFLAMPLPRNPLELP